MQPNLTPTRTAPQAPSVVPKAPPPNSVAAPSSNPLLSDKRYKVLEATMRRHGYAGHGLIEALHTAQESFGYLDDFTLKHVARTLRLPYSKVYGVATFYNFFTLKPQGAHTCVVCLGTACYIRGARATLGAIEKRFGLKPGQTTPDNRLSLLTARCFGSCALAPVVVLDGETIGKVQPDALAEHVNQVLVAASAR